MSDTHSAHCSCRCNCRAPKRASEWRAYWGGHHDPAIVYPDKWEGVLRIERHALDAGGYDARGRYFGTPSTLYHVTCDGDDWVDFFVRAGDDVASVDVTRRCYPAAQVFFSHENATVPSFPAGLVHTGGQPSPYSGDECPDTERASVQAFSLAYSGDT